MISTAWDGLTGRLCPRIIAKRAIRAGMARAAAGEGFQAPDSKVHRAPNFGRMKMIRIRIDRRAVLGALAGVPGLRLLFPAGSALAQERSPARDVIRELGVRPCINAAGTYTALTGSLMSPEVVAGMQVASQ